MTYNDGNAAEMICRKKFRNITERLIDKGLTITTMESCTGGMVASLITDTEGSSAIMKGAFVTYSNEAKIRCGVPAGIIEAYGVYSIETSEAMARAAAAAYDADVAVGITGSFGNVDPANPDSVPGEVFFSIFTADGAGRSDRVVSFSISGLQAPDRHSAKVIAADIVADRLLEILK